MGKGEIMFLVISVSLCIFIIPFSIADDVPTYVEVDSSNNIPPILNITIPNQIWASNTNLSNALDLDNYFTDTEILHYTASSVSNINITINPTTNQVSFYPDYGFAGIRTVVFTAYDIVSSTNSNVVTLNVTEDNQAPGWSNPAKDKGAVSQNTLVTFTTDWIDNFALSYYVFSINQAGTWINSSSVSFSGIQNISTQSIQISASPGSSVSWRFFAFDTSGNMNVTDTQSFSIAAQEVITPTETSGATTTKKTTTKKTSIREIFASNPAFSISPEGPIKIEMKQGATTAISFKIINTGNIDLLFELDTQGFSDFNPLISQRIFNLTAGKSNAVVIEFKADRHQRPDIYYGGALFTTSIGIKKIPIIITVNPLESKLGLNLEIYPEFKRVYSGNKVRSNFTVQSLGDFIIRNVTLYYAITDFEGKVYNSATEELNFDQPLKSLEKEFNLSKEIIPGEYLLIGRVLSDNDIAIDTDTFEVIERFNLRGFIKTNFILLSVILLSALLITFIMRYQKSKSRLRVLNLYLLVTELNKLMKKGKTEEAIGLYIRIKSLYGEPVASTTLQNKTQLKQEIETLVQKLNLQKNIENPGTIEEKPENEEKPKEEIVQTKKTHKEILAHLKEAHNQESPAQKDEELKQDSIKEETKQEIKQEEKEKNNEEKKQEKEENEKPEEKK